CRTRGRAPEPCLAIDQAASSWPLTYRTLDEPVHRSRPVCRPRVLSPYASSRGDSHSAPERTQQLRYYGQRLFRPVVKLLNAARHAGAGNAGSGCVGTHDPQGENDYLFDQQTNNQVDNREMLLHATQHILDSPEHVLSIDGGALFLIAHDGRIENSM